MSMKYVIGFVRLRQNMPYLQTMVKFKWQYGVEMEVCRNLRAAEPNWEKQLVEIPSKFGRAHARVYRAQYLHNPQIRNVKLKRRLVQVNWDTYNDSFKHNAKGNGNGR